MNQNDCDQGTTVAWHLAKTTLGLQLLLILVKTHPQLFKAIDLNAALMKGEYIKRQISLEKLLEKNDGGLELLQTIKKMNTVEEEKSFENKNNPPRRSIRLKQRLFQPTNQEQEQEKPRKKHQGAWKLR
jgi:hypothetical protein